MTYYIARYDTPYGPGLHSTSNTLKRACKIARAWMRKPGHRRVFVSDKNRVAKLVLGYTVIQCV
jgi:hypothetical protein